MTALRRFAPVLSRSAMLAALMLALGGHPSAIDLADDPIRPNEGKRRLPAAEAQGLRQRPAPANDVDPEIPTIRIDAIVTDRQGRPILDLGPSEFELMENGAARPIGSVELRRGTLTPDTSPIVSDEDEMRAARQPGTRVFAIILDEFHITAGEATERARDAATHLIDVLAPSDMAVVLKPMDSINAIRFSRDRGSMRAAIASFAGRKGDFASRTPFEEEYIGRAPVVVQAARAQIVTAALRELTLRLGELKADRGVVVLVSEGFPRDNPGARQVRMPDLQGIVRASSRFHLAMYTLDPGDRERATPGSERERAAATLVWLASQTGGRYHSSAPAEEGPASGSEDNLRAGLQRMSADLGSYYALTYQPAKADGRFHTLEVRSTRRDAQVRTRAGYWAPLAAELNALRGSGATRLAASRRLLHRSPVISAWVGLGRTEAEGRLHMAVTWARSSNGPPALTPQTVLVRARTSSGEFLFEGSIGAAGESTVADLARFSVPPGRVELDLAVIGLNGQVLDTDIRNIEVPDFTSGRPGPIVLPPEIVLARTARDHQSALANPLSTPSPVRVFARGDRLVIRVPAFDPSGEGVDVGLKVLNRRMQPMRTIPPFTAVALAVGTLTGSESTPAAQGSHPAPPERGVTMFSLPLSWLPPGEYELEVTAANSRGSARERIGFRVR